ncbi:MAG: ShlB/FhaC/HecB family hemolysin secretion/activation protein, partial [Janthinobacterium lividum]|nr:ShlB/FhaC/HecB family hemolysin secretion/activation protein [Janthinobacterium lividum]
MQQIEKERGVGLPQSPPPKIAPAPQAMKPISGATVTLTRFQFSGNVLLSDAELADVVAQYLNRPIGYAEMQQAAAAVAELYRKRGWIVRAYLPEQDIHDGSVTIEIVEAIFGNVKLEGTAAKRLTLEQLQRGFEARQAKGTVIDKTALDRALLLADDLPGVAVSGRLQEGSNARETDLIIKLADEAFVLGEVSLDNFGARSTGSNRLTANLNLTSPLGVGDLLGGNLIHTRGTDYLRLAYTLPVGADGWRLGASASALAYRLTAAEFAALNGKGSSATAGIDAYYPLVRSRFKNLFLGINYDIRRFDNESSFATQSRYRSNALALNL